MMEIKQSTPNGLELKELKEEPINGLKTLSGGELEPNDILQLSDSENEEEDIVKSSAEKNESVSLSVTYADAMDSSIKDNTGPSDNISIEKDLSLVTSMDAIDASENKSNDECSVVEEPQEVHAASIVEQEDEKQENENDCATTKSSSSYKENEEKEQASDDKQEKDDAHSRDTLISEEAGPTTEKGEVDAKSNELAKDQSDVNEKEKKKEEKEATDTQNDPQIVPDSEIKEDSELLASQEEETLEISSEAGSVNNVSKMDVDNTIELDDSDEETDSDKVKTYKTESVIELRADIEKNSIIDAELGVDSSEIPKTSADIRDYNPTDDKDVDPLLSKIDEVLGDDSVEQSKTDGKGSISEECALKKNAEAELPNSIDKEQVTQDCSTLFDDTAKESTKTGSCESQEENDDDVVVLLEDDCENVKEVPNEDKKESETIPKDKESSSKTVDVKDNAVDNEDEVVLLDCDEKSAREDRDENSSKSENQENNLPEDILKPNNDAKVDLDNKNLDQENANKDAEDVVVVLDEDMDDSETNKCPSSDAKLKDETDGSAKESKPSPSDEKNQSEVEETSEVIEPDNSDNAQDKFPEDQEKGNANVETTSPENDNLLEQVASPQNTDSNDRFYEEPEEKQSDTESSEVSQDISKKLTIEYDEQSKDITIELDDENEAARKENAGISENKSFKRSLSPDVTLLEAKKIKISGESSENEDNKRDKKHEDIKPTIEASKKPKTDLNLDFLKRFKKPLSKMSKSDLEELVLQKIVEAILHRSELSDMRELIEKQEKLIASHRTKIAEITKQFRDLEMVHNRVTKDLEQKNQQFIMPVKITRAVGLQVLIPKRSEHAINTSVKNIVSSPLNSNPSTPKAGGPTITPVAPLNDNSKRTRPNEVTSTEPAKRIRCNQKVTPLRPDTPKRNTVILNHSTKISPALPSTATQTQQNTSTPNSTKPVAFKTVMRNVVPSQQQQQQASPHTGVLQTASQVHVVDRAVSASSMSNSSQLIGNTAVRKSTTPKPVQPNGGQKIPINNFQSSPERRVPPVILKKASNGRNMTVANPPPPAAQNTNKSVIDLTDEDEKPAGGNGNPPALVAIPQTTKSAAQAQSRVTTYVISKPNAPQRTSPMGQNGNANAAARNRFVPIAPKPASQAAQSALASGMRAQQTNIAAVTTLSAKRISAPAPLPKPPNVPSHPSWKAPPPRPTIRINNIESGIVISWTMDDSNDGNAEVTNYQIYAYQETSAPPQSDAWRHVGDVKAMLLPMAVTLTQFQEGQRYFFAVRAIDIHGRYGPFSIPKTWS